MFGSNPYHRTLSSTAAQAIRSVVKVAAHCPDGETAIAPPAPRTRSPMYRRDACEASATGLPVWRGEENMKKDLLKPPTLYH